MSAFICDDRHISALACYAVENGLLEGQTPNSDKTDQEIVASLLHAANVESVNARYSESTEEPFEFGFVETRMTPAVQVIKAAHCYQYQACEHGGWEGSRAHRITDAIIAHAIQRVSGYGDAMWGWQ